MVKICYSACFSFIRNSFGGMNPTMRDSVASVPSTLINMTVGTPDILNLFRNTSASGESKCVKSTFILFMSFVA